MTAPATPSSTSNASSFQTKYLQKCSELRVEPHPALTEHLARFQALVTPASSDSLDLRGHSATLRDCTALASALADDCLFTTINLADSFLDDDGCILISNALKTNNMATHLDLRGNSIRADGATALGQMLKINCTLKSLVLEWNCIGIWQAGVRALADGLSVNQTLQELDLRNNKIGPEGAASLAQSLKHNLSLQKLDLRWNNIGLTGCKALVDMLKWNTALEEIQLAGNEVPDELAKSIAIALERNANRRKHDRHSRLQADEHAHAVEQLSSSHRGHLQDLRRDLVAKDLQLDAASKEIAKTQEAYRILEQHLAKAKADIKELNSAAGRDVQDLKARLGAALKEAASEREALEAMRATRDKALSQVKQKELELEAAHCEAEVRKQTTKREHSALTEELNKANETIRATQRANEERLKRLQNEHEVKISALEVSKDTQWGERVRKLEERLRKAESDYARLEEDTAEHRSKLLAEKRNWADQLAQAEAQWKKEKSDREKEWEADMAAAMRARDSLQTQLTAQSLLTAKATRELEAERDRWQQGRTELLEEIASLEKKLSKTTSTRSQLEEVRKLLSDAESRIATLSTQITRLQDKLDREAEQRKGDRLKAQEDLDSKDRIIARLKELVRSKEQELRDRDDENVLQMKELQLSIASVIASRSRSTVRSTAVDKTLT
ncbi:hypothetical protein HDU86_003329 [Geranomyces michiganensis]|nr:hypothetical protein HDU86_003329 [Geranomyces michiganensis]